MTLAATSVEHVVNQIMESPAPILFPDTCTLVDLIRVPYRVRNADQAEKILKAARQLIYCSQTVTPNLWIVILPPIYNEWREHSQGAVSELQKHWANLDSQIKVAYACANAAGTMSLPPMQQFSTWQIEKVLLDLSKKFVTNSIFLDENSGCVNRAYARLVRKEAPARQGGGEMKDCTIVEHCIELCASLRDAGFVEKCTFSTSNTKDFCKTGSKTEPKKPLDDQFNALNLSLTTNWQWTKAELSI